MSIWAQAHRNAHSPVISPLRYQLRARAQTAAIPPARITPLGLRHSQPGMIAASGPVVSHANARLAASHAAGAAQSAHSGRGGR